MPRIKTTAQIADYMGRPMEVEAYVPREGSRFAVTRRDAKAPWVITHRGSGMVVQSLLPVTVRPTVAELLAIVSAWEAQTHLDLEALDSAQFGKGFARSDEVIKRRVQRVSHELRDIALQTVVVRAAQTAVR